eukprot:3833345-Rhodomonas_salina.1
MRVRYRQIGRHTPAQYRASHSSIRSLTLAQRVAPYAKSTIPSRYRTAHSTIRRAQYGRPSQYAAPVPSSHGVGEHHMLRQYRTLHSMRIGC